MPLPKAWAIIDGIDVLGDPMDLKGLGLLNRTLSHHNTTEDYFTDVAVLITPPRLDFNNWFDEGEQVMLWGEDKHDLLALYQHFRADGNYKVALSLNPAKEEELLKLMLGIGD